MLPDVLPAARGFLRGHASIAALVSTRVFAHRVPDGYSPTNPDGGGWLLLTPTGEASITNTHVDRTVDVALQVEGFGRYLEDHAWTRALVATAHDLLRSEFPAYSDASVHVASVLPDVGLQPLPDDEFGRARVVAGVRVIAHPQVPAA